MKDILKEALTMSPEAAAEFNRMEQRRLYNYMRAAARARNADRKLAAADAKRARKNAKRAKESVA